MTVIHKTLEDWRVSPNLTDYEQTRAAFRWSTAPNPCVGMGSGLCNIAYAAVDRHADGPMASRTALRFVSALGQNGAVAIRDLSYAELGKLARRFTNVLRSLGITKGSDGTIDLPVGATICSLMLFLAPICDKKIHSAAIPTPRVMPTVPSGNTISTVATVDLP